MDGQNCSAFVPPVTGFGDQRAGVVPQLIGTDPGELRHAECDEALGLRGNRGGDGEGRCRIGWSYGGHIP